MHRQHLHCEHAGQGEPEHAVTEEIAGKGGASFVAGIEDIEELKQHKSGEGQRQGVLLRIGLQGVVQHAQRARHHGRAISDQFAQPPQGEDARFGVAWRFIHQAGAGGIHAERHGGGHP